MDLSLSYSKYSTSQKCILKYIQNYVTKPIVPKEPLSYPLALGTLSHLFIYLYHHKGWEMDRIRKMREDLSQLYELTSLEYLAKDFKTYNYAVKTIDVSDNVSELIAFIEANEAVYYQAYKFFKMYLTDTFYKFEDASVVSEFTFNNLQPYNDDMICMYGSIDLIFWKMKQQILHYLYFADFKSGKSIDDFALDQLHFYFYNILNYNFDMPIENNPDNMDVVRLLNSKLSEDVGTMKGIIFKLRDSDTKAITLGKNSPDYQKFVDNMWQRIGNVILPIHRMKKSDIDLHTFADQYQSEFGFVDKGECMKKEQSFHCNYCKFISLCEYRIKRG